MVCLYCGNSTRVVNSRTQKSANGTWRRRRCNNCKAIFTSLERIEYQSSLAVRYQTSHIMPFNRDRLFLSIYQACLHRPRAIEDATAITDTIIHKLLTLSATDGIIIRNNIIQTASATLQVFDHVACIQYDAFHHLDAVN